MPFIITVQASKAYQNGIKFYQGNKTTYWLVDYVSPKFIGGIFLICLTHIPEFGNTFTRSRLSLSILIIHLVPSPSPFLYFSTMSSMLSLTTQGNAWHN